MKEDWNLSLLNKNNIKGEITKHKLPKYFVFYRTETSSAIENIEPLFAKFLSYCTQYNINISIKNMEEKTQDIYEAVVIMSKRAKQILSDRVVDEMISVETVKVFKIPVLSNSRTSTSFLKIFI